MRRTQVKFYLSIGLRTRQEEIIEVEDNATEEQIEEMYQEWINDYIDGYWERVEEES